MAAGRKTGGRQKGTLNKVTAEVRELAGKHGPDAIDKLAWLMANGDSHAVQKAAADSLLDRAYGRPTQMLGQDPDAAPVLRVVYVDPTKRDDQLVA